MKILITGAGGFLGGRLARSLLSYGQHDLRLHYRRKADSDDLSTLVAQYPEWQLEVVTANLLRPPELKALVSGVDLIIHAAAGTRGAVADMFLNSVVGTRNLLDATAGAGCRRIALVSSFAMYCTANLASGAIHDEQCGLEASGIDKGAYAFTKIQQEMLFCEYQRRFGFEYVILRPGVIYGPGGGAFSPRVGLKIGSTFLELGGRCLLPLSYVDNCADAIVFAALHAPSGASFSVVDGDLPTCSQYLARYKQQVAPLTSIRVPRWAFLAGVHLVARYNRRSQGQLPANFNSYILRSMYRRLQYSNQALKNLGWTQRVETDEAIGRTFDYLRNATRRETAL